MIADTNPQKPATQNVVETALAAGKELAVKPQANPAQDGVPFVVVTKGNGDQVIEFLEKRFDRPARKMGLVKLSDEASFLEYWARQKSGNSAIYGALDPSQFLAVFDDHGAEAEYRQHRALYKLELSREYQSWKGRDRQTFDSNDKFALWIEDQLPDFVEPTGAAMMEIALNMRVNQSAAFSNAVRLQDGNTEFAFTNNVEAASTVNNGKIRIPEQFKLRIPVFAGLQSKAYEFEARFRFRLASGKLSIWYELIRPHKVIEQAFADMLASIEASAKTKVIFGTPE